MSRSVLLKKNFLLLWSSQILSQFTINIMNFLVLIHIFDKTGSTIASSFIWIAYGIPAIILGPIAAAAVDMGDKRKIMMVANFAQAIAILIYSLLYKEFLFLSYGVVVIYSVLDQFYVPAETASIPILASKKNLANANGLFFLSAQAAAILGFGLAGLVREAIGFGTTMMIGTILLLIGAAATYHLPPLKPKKDERKDKLEDRLVQYFERMREGFHLIRESNAILYPFLFLVILQVIMVIIVVNLPQIGKEIVQTGSSFVGIVTVVPAGIGALIGTLITTKLIDKGIRKKVIIQNSLFLASISFLSVPLLIPLLEFWFGRLILVLSFLFVGGALVGALVPSLTFMQENTPEQFMARVFGNFWVIAYTATLIPVLFSATISEVLGTKIMLTSIGAVLMVIYLYLKIKIPKILKQL